MEWDGLWYATHPDVYEPSDDTWLLAKAVGEHVGAGDRFLEVGCGAGIVAMTAGRNGAQVTVTDRNHHAVHLATANARENKLAIQGVVADLAAGLRGPFDVVAFNPPYLPTGPDDVVSGPLNWAFDGGLDGNEVVLRFARQIQPISPRLVLVVHSSLSDPAPLADAMAEAGYECEVERAQRFFYEELTVRAFRR